MSDTTSAINSRKHPSFPDFFIERVRQRILSADILRRHWWKILVMVGLIIIGLEFLERLSESFNSNVLFDVEVLLTALLLTVIGFLGKMLILVINERTQAIETLEQKHAVSTQLSMMKSVSEISRQVVENAFASLPLKGINLWVYNPFADELYSGASMGLVPLEGKRFQEDFRIESCEACILRNPEFPIQICNCPRVKYLHIPLQTEDYCLPLMRSSRLVGLVHLYMSVITGSVAEPVAHEYGKEVQPLIHVAPEISSSLQIAIETKMREEIELRQTVDKVQLDLARDIHDTIGQNIGYLRMNLAGLIEKNPPMAAEIKTQLQRLCEVTNESYDLVRGTLSMLKLEDSAGLANLLSAHANNVAERSGLIIDFRSLGQPRPLDSRALRQVFYIFREALSNIEKHAKASHVNIALDWAGADLTLSICDDGCGFDPRDAQRDNHYGLDFMTERTQSLNGQFTLWSVVGDGTSISIRLPYQVN